MREKVLQLLNGEELKLSKKRKRSKKFFASFINYDKILGIFVIKFYKLKTQIFYNSSGILFLLLLFIQPKGSGQYLFSHTVHLKKPQITNKYIFAKGIKINNDIQPLLSKSCNLFI